MLSVDLQSPNYRGVYNATSERSSKATYESTNNAMYVRGTLGNAVETFLSANVRLDEVDRSEVWIRVLEGLFHPEARCIGPISNAH